MNGWLYSYNINNPKLIGFFLEVFVIKTKQGIIIIVKKRIKIDVIFLNMYY